MTVWRVADWVLPRLQVPLFWSNGPKRTEPALPLWSVAQFTRTCNPTASVRYGARVKCGLNDAGSGAGGGDQHPAATRTSATSTTEEPNRFRVRCPMNWLLPCPPSPASPDGCAPQPPASYRDTAGMRSTEFLPQRVTRLGLGARPALQASQPHPFDGVVLALVEHETRALARRLDVVAQVRRVDLGPDVACDFDGFVVVEPGEVTEERRLVAKGGAAQREEALDVPLLDVGLERVDVDGEVEEVGHDRPRLAARRRV